MTPTVPYNAVEPPMNRPDHPGTLMPIPDMQSARDDRHLAIDQVGTDRGIGRNARGVGADQFAAQFGIVERHRAQIAGAHRLEHIPGIASEPHQVERGGAVQPWINRRMLWRKNSPSSNSVASTPCINDNSRK